VLLGWLDALVITTGLGAGELAETRTYTERLAAAPTARNVAVGVLAIGDPSASELALEQLGSRLASLPTIGHLPRLGGGTANPDAFDDRALDGAFAPIIHWILDAAKRTDAAAPSAPSPADSVDQHVANRLYRELVDP
jgi:hypothetical protein